MIEVKVVIEKIKDKSLSLKERVIDYYQNNRLLSLIVAGLFLIILLCLILLFSMSSSKNKKANQTIITQPLILSEELQIPASPELPEDYSISRITKAEWTTEEAEEWFTIPSQKEINALSQTNTNMINELLGATP